MHNISRKIDRKHCLVRVVLATNTGLGNSSSGLGKKNYWGGTGHFDKFLVHKSPFGLRYLSFLLLH